MQTKMNIELDNVWKQNYFYIKSKKDLLKLASIIDSESNNKKEKYIISSVFHNRIKKSMRLQSDPTVLYAKQFYTNKNLRTIYKNDLKKDSPWNTYTRKGLPKTPICNPGLDAIHATLNPIETNFLYFVADGIGGHNFSSSLSEHKKNVKLWKNRILKK